MKYLLLICWDAERMNAQTTADATAPGTDPVRPATV